MNRTLLFVSQRLKRWLGFPMLNPITAALFFIALSIVSNSWAQPKPPQILSNSAYRAVAKAQAAISAEEYIEALTVLDELAERNRRLTPYDQAKIWHLKLYIYNHLEQYDNAMSAAENAIAGNALDDITTANITFNLISLSAAADRGEKSVRYLQQWLDLTADPGAQGYFVAAQVYATVEQYESGLQYAQRGMDRHLQDQQQQQIEPKKEWYQIFSALLMRQRQFERASPVLQTMLNYWPTEAGFYRQLMAAYQLSGEGKKAFAVLAIGVRNQVLSQADDLQRLAQFYRYHNYPYPAAVLMEQALATGMIKSNFETWSELSNTFLQARQWQQAEDYLLKAAPLAGTGKPYLLVCQTRFQQEAWSDVNQYCQQAIATGALAEDYNHAWKLMALAHYYRDQLPAARDAFAECAKGVHALDDCGQWRDNLDKTIAERKRLADEEATEQEAQKQRRQQRMQAVGQAVSNGGFDN